MSANDPMSLPTERERATLAKELALLPINYQAQGKTFEDTARAIDTKLKELYDSGHKAGHDAAIEKAAQVAEEKEEVIGALELKYAGCYQDNGVSMARAAWDAALKYAYSKPCSKCGGLPIEDRSVPDEDGGL